MEASRDEQRPEVKIIPKGTLAAKAEGKKQIGGNHYSNMAITPTRYILENNIGWLEGNAIKYISRYKNKNGVEDLKKAIHYIELIIEKETK